MLSPKNVITCAWKVLNITESVMTDVREWQNRPLEKSYPILFLDALRINSRQDGKKLYVALQSILRALTCVFPTIITPAIYTEFMTCYMESF